MLTSQHHVISSLSPEWVQTVHETGRFGAAEWDSKQTVAVTTLDNLITHYGIPAFIKIDVEGFEDQVLAGMTQNPMALSFEFTPEFIASTHRCIAHLCSLGAVAFQVSVGESMEFLLPEWVSANDLRQVLAKMPSECFGDIYAHFRLHACDS